MSLRRTLLRGAPTLALALLLCNASAAEESAQVQGPGPRLRELLTAVGTPAKEEAVRDLLAEPEVWTAAGGQAAAGALWHAGGYAAAQGLCRLLKHTEPTVVRAALDGLVAVDLRVAGVSAVRRAVREKDADVRASAHEALARMGDVTDVEGLLQRLAGDDPAARSQAHRTLARLTGQTLKAEPRRWSAWWEQEVPRSEQRLREALDLLGAGATQSAEPATPAQVEDAWQVVERHGWLDVEGLTSRALEWLNLWTPEGRSYGYRLATLHRLGELAPAVARARRQDRKGPAADLARAACLRLGVSPDT